MPTIVPNLWFDTQAEEAVQFYTSLFADGEVHEVQTYGPDNPEREGQVMFVEWTMLGQRYGAINGGPMFSFSEAVSFEVRCETQGEIDTLWSALAEGGDPGPCGWIKDRFGFSWQVTPSVLTRLMADPGTARLAVGYFMGLDKQPFVIADLERAVAS